MDSYIFSNGTVLFRKLRLMVHFRSYFSHQSLNWPIPAKNSSLETMITKISKFKL